MELILLHTYHRTDDLATDTNPEAVKLREVLASNTAAAARYEKLGFLEKELISVSCVIVGELTDADASSRLQSSHLSYHLLNPQHKLPADWLLSRMSSSRPEGARRRQRFAKFTHVGFGCGNTAAHLARVALASAVQEPMPLWMRRDAEYFDLDPAAVDVLLNNADSPRNSKAAVTVATVREAYARVLAGQESTENAMQCLLTLSYWLGVY